MLYEKLFLFFGLFWFWPDKANSILFCLRPKVSRRITTLQEQTNGSCWHTIKGFCFLFAAASSYYCIIVLQIRKALPVAIIHCRSLHNRPTLRLNKQKLLTNSAVDQLHKNCMQIWTFDFLNLFTCCQCCACTSISDDLSAWQCLLLMVACQFDMA